MPINRIPIVPKSASKSTKTYTIESLSSVFDSLGIPYKRVGREINADIDRTGHYSYKISPKKSVYFVTDGCSKGGTLAGLLRKLQTDTSNIPATQLDCSNDSHKKTKEISRIIKDSEPFAEINDAGKTAIEKYFMGRSLPLILPETARVSVVPQGYKLIIPLFEIEKSEIPAVHITLITKSGEKRPQDCFGGKHRYVKGNLKTESGSMVFSHINGDTEQLSVSEKTKWIGIGEGLETVIAGRILSGWSSIFAISDMGIKSFFDNPKNLEPFKKTQTGLAIFVDRDLSEAGQKASAALAYKAKEAGIPVLFLLPPSIIKGGKKGADWNDTIKELGADGAMGALKIAISRSERELEAVEVEESATTLDFVSTSDHEPVRYDRIPVNEAFSEMYSFLKNRFHEKSNTPELHALPPGLGKSSTSADLARDNALAGRPGIRLITPTKKLAREFAKNSGGLAREGRSGEENSVARCEIFPEVIPFSEKWRSAIAHKCTSCLHGKAAMAIIKGDTLEDPSVKPCQYIIHTNQAKEEPVVATTAAMMEGDPGYDLIRTRSGKVVKSNVVLDDHSKIDGICQRGIQLEDLGQWVRAGEKMTMNQENSEAGKITIALVSEVKKMAGGLASNMTDEVVRLNPADWTDFSRLAKDPAIKLMDATTLEAVHKDKEGKLEIPFRAIRDIGIAIERGTAWVFKGQLFYSVPNETLRAIQDGATVEDATPSRAVEHIVRARGGEIRQIFTVDGLKTKLVPDGGHGRVACTGEQSKKREQNTLSRLVLEAVEVHGEGNVCVLTHKPLVEEIRDKFPSVEFGWFGNHNRGQNEWKEKKHLIIFGVPQLSPSTIERLYGSERMACLESGCNPEEWPEFDGTRTTREYRIPGQKMVMTAEGFLNEKIDDWYRLWVTAEVVQCLGRLRSIRRTDEELSSEIHTTFPLSEAYGLEFSSVERGTNRTMSEYHKSRKDDQIERVMVATGKDGVISFRKLNEKMKTLFGKGISARDYKESVSVTRQDNSYIVSGNTPDFFGKDMQQLIRKLEEWAEAMKSLGISPQEFVDGALVDPDPIEIAAFELIKRMFPFKGEVYYDDPVPDRVS